MLGAKVRTEVAAAMFFAENQLVFLILTIILDFSFLLCRHCEAQVFTNVLIKNWIANKHHFP